MSVIMGIKCIQRSKKIKFNPDLLIDHKMLILLTLFIYFFFLQGGWLSILLICLFLSCNRDDRQESLVGARNNVRLIVSSKRMLRT